jgi:hypothetical protein
VTAVAATVAATVREEREDAMPRLAKREELLRAG